MQRIDFLRVFSVLLLIIFLSTGLPDASAQEPDHIKIRKVKFSGVEEVSKKALAGSLVTRVPPFWKFWEPHPVISVKDLDSDLLRIKHYYQGQGYYQTIVEYTITPVHPEEMLPEPLNKNGRENGKGKESNDGKKTIPEYDIGFQITEGPAVIVRDIDIECLCELETLTDGQIRDATELAQGKRFKTETYDQAKIQIRKLLGNRGYPFAEVLGNAVVDLNDNSADITFDINAGQLYNFGDIRITGNEDFVNENVIRRAMTFKSGERFASRDLDASRRNLFDLNIFRTAVLKMGEPEQEKNTVPVDIQVKPRKKQSVKLGVGYGTDDGVRLQAAWIYRNLTSRADRLTFRARRSDILENIYAEYLFPYFLSSRNNLVTTAGYEKEEKDYYTLQKTSAELNFYRKLEENWFSSIGYNLENNRPEDIHVEDSDGLVDPRDTEDFLVSSVKFHLEHNTVDDVLNSRKGTSIGFTIENASDYLGTEVSYIRPGIDAKIFIPVPWDMVLAGRVEFRTIQESGDTDYIPISKQFFLGGSKSVRGFGFEKLGVIDENDVIRDVSGLSSFTSNIELRFPVYKDFGGVAFLDAGALNDNSFEVDLNSLRYTTGLGLRYNTIIGPIQLDFGYQLNPAKSTATDDPNLMDLLDKDRWYLHFNIGQAF